MIKAIALDDEPPALEIIETFCAKISTIQLIKTFTQSGEAANFLQKNTLDLLFLDINMPSVSGLEFAKMLAEKTMVIFTTGYSEYALESYGLNAIDYLLKPFTFSRFKQAIEKANQKYLYINTQIPSTIETPLLFKADYGIVKILPSQIIFIEGLDNYLKIHFINQKSMVVRLTMKAIMEKLLTTQFLRVHRSFIVAVDKIEAIRNKTIFIVSDEIPIGSSYEETVLAAFKQ